MLSSTDYFIYAAAWITSFWIALYPPSASPAQPNPIPPLPVTVGLTPFAYHCNPTETGADCVLTNLESYPARACIQAILVSFRDPRSLVSIPVCTADVGGHRSVEIKLPLDVVQILELCPPAWDGAAPDWTQCVVNVREMNISTFVSPNLE